MDFKGVDWAGNMHEKFDAMYSEVEETIHQDTIKYVENQLQKVGVSVKKFYAEVLDELYASSCILPPRGVARPIYKNKVDVGEDICDLTTEDSSLSVRSDAKHLSAMSRRVLVGNTQSGECSKKSKAAGVSRAGIKIISQAPKMSRPMSSFSGDEIVRGVKSNCLVSSDDLNVTKSSEPFVRHDTGEAVTTKEIKNKCISDQILSTESVKQEEEKKNSVCICPAPDKDSSAESPRQNNGATNDCFDIEVIETEDVEKSEMDHHFVSQGTKKHKSYKKKIYNVLSLKSRSTGKQDQDACVSDHEDSSEKNASYDFGWELL